ncbi:MAG: hypothetical protein AB1324_03300 [Candidatus Micrarchaeota archaeon]
MAHKLPLDARMQSGCTSCKSACSVNQLLRNFPPSTQKKLDALVVSINEFNSACGTRGTIDERMVAGFRKIMAAVGSMLDTDGPSMPELENALMALMEREGGPQFKYLLSQVVG